MNLVRAYELFINQGIFARCGAPEKYMRINNTNTCSMILCCSTGEYRPQDISIASNFSGSIDKTHVLRETIAHWWSLYIHRRQFCLDLVCHFCIFWCYWYFTSLSVSIHQQKVSCPRPYHGRLQPQQCLACSQHAHNPGKNNPTPGNRRKNCITLPVRYGNVAMKLSKTTIYYVTMEIVNKASGIK